MTVESDNETQMWEMYFQKSSFKGEKARVSICSVVLEKSVHPSPRWFATGPLPPLPEENSWEWVRCTRSGQTSGGSFNHSCPLTRCIVDASHCLVVPSPQLS